METPQEEPTTYVIGDYQLDTMKEKLIYANDNNMISIIPLSHRESEILRLLCRNKGEEDKKQGCIAPVVGRRQLFQHPQPPCVHHQTAPQALPRPSYKDNQREGNRI